MQIGRVGYGYGTSSLWHDPDYHIERPLYPVEVTRSLEYDLPSQEHVEPPKAKDPYIAQEKSYDVAFRQMELGIEGREFLHGVKDKGAFDAALLAKSGDLDETATLVVGTTGAPAAGAQSSSQPQLVRGINTPLDVADEAIYQQQAVVQSSRVGRIESPDQAAVNKAHEQMERMGAPPPGQVVSSQATRTATYNEAEKAAEAMKNYNQVTEAVSMVGGSVFSAAAMGAGAAQAAQAAQGAAQSAISLEGIVGAGSVMTGQANSAADAMALEDARRRQNQKAYQKAFRSLTPGIDPDEYPERPLGVGEQTEALELPESVQLAMGLGSDQPTEPLTLPAGGDTAPVALESEEASEGGTPVDGPADPEKA